ncbi:hypothetical protein BS47DRAFT_643564 [Hydnum rufescens UP504]|uniref:Alpha N-terminal protein methyltransferase 1 n=1 Tax=Hydnum rufescens UP504 TaxID=1448309 RepID=A0A9P6E279_9AGAM|nr:hypothetical protein BS47DRAFT_643564 [Hydnum rufescens UP504]
MDLQSPIATARNFKFTDVRPVSFNWPCTILKMALGHDGDNEDQNVRAGLDYWEAIPASIDGVLGGFGNGPLPRVDALGSRQFLLGLMPSLCTVPSALRRLEPWPPLTRRVRALDVGAGIGRVTQTVLLPLVHDVVLLEPISKFIAEAQRLAPSWRGIADASKSVTFIQGTLQTYDPSTSYATIPATRVPGVTSASSIQVLGRVGYIPPEQQEELGFDVIWCQWCLGHLSDPDLVVFLRQCKASLRQEGKTALPICI